MQIDHNKQARKRLITGDPKFWGWAAAIMFYEIAVAVDGYAEMLGMQAPRSHRARRALVKKHFPLLAELYNDLYGLSLTARYYEGYSMTEGMWRRAVQCYEILASSIPVHSKGTADMV